MPTLAKSARLSDGHSGPASEVADELRLKKNAHFVAIEIRPEYLPLEKPLLRGFYLLVRMMKDRFTEVQEDQLRRMGDLLLENVEMPETTVIESEMRAHTIRHLIEDGVWLSATQIAEQGGYSRSNPAEPANRWKREGKVFAVTFKGHDLYAAYQFDSSMKPRPVIAEALKIFKHKNDSWAIAAWFASVNGWLRGKRPQDCLDESALVTKAALQEVSGFNG